MDSTPDPNEKRSRRSFLTTTGAAATTAVIAGCSGDSGSDPESTADTTQGTEESESEDTGSEGTDDEEKRQLRLLSDDLDTIDPVRATNVSARTVMRQILEGLVNLKNGETEVTNLLAQDYDISDDGTKYTFHLEEGVEFSDGTELTAHDFVYSWERLAGAENTRLSDEILDSGIGVVHEKEVVEEDGEEIEQYKSGTLDVEATDDYTLEMTLDSPFPATLQYLCSVSFTAVPEGIVGDIEGYDGDVSYDNFADGSELIGSGPFLMGDWSTSTEVEVTARDDYRGEGPHVSGVHWNITTDQEATYNYSMNKNSDSVSVSDAAYDPNKITVEGTDDRARQYGTYGPLRNGETADWYGVNELNVYYVVFNLSNTEKAVREAFSYVLDRQEINEEISKGRWTPAYHMTPPTVFPGGPDAAEEHAENNYPYGYKDSDIAKAREVMEDAGYSADDPYELEIGTYESYIPALELIRDKIQSAHVNMQIEGAPVSTLLSQVRNGSRDGALINSTGIPTPHDFVGRFTPITWTGSEDDWRGSEWTPDSTPAAERVVDAWETVNDNMGGSEEEEQARNDSYVEIEEANWEDIVRCTLWYRTTEVMHYQWVDRPRIGSARSYYQRLNTTRVGERE